MAFKLYDELRKSFNRKEVDDFEQGFFGKLEQQAGIVLIAMDAKITKDMFTTMPLIVSTVACIQKVPDCP